MGKRSAPFDVKPYLDFSRELVREFGSVARPLLAAPAVQIVAATVLIEYLQRVYTGTGVFSWQSQPGTHARIWKEETSPLISQPLATTLEAVIISTEALKSVGANLELLLPLLLGKGA